MGEPDEFAGGASGMGAVLKRFSCPRLPGPFSAIQCEGQNAKITGFEVPRKRKVYSGGGGREAFQEELHLAPAERMLLPLSVCAFQLRG